MDGDQNKVPIIQEERISDLLHHLDIEKTVGPDVIHPRVLRKLTEVLTEPLSIFYQQSWLAGEVPFAGHCDIHLQESRKEDPGNYRPVNLASVLSNIMEQNILNAITRHAKDNQGIRPRQHGFMKDRSYLINLISFYNKSVDERRAVDAVCPDSSRDFDSDFHSILTEKLAARGLDRCTLC
ncbi:hypothetical protein DUI87_08483 [Hirundo rustica rustica]|uniref:Reverse transcriptase domain-containing protein n=1 Tax=Hirundo rustica rustica TaxID=333673 RepID=A0A3M0KSK2_HIRRU|nr:hypothetical protein DUI87_08483 [Hirundo rustica rustica]